MARSKSYLEISGGPHRSDLMTWPNPADPEEVGWRLVYTPNPSRGDVLVAASFMDAYQALIYMPQRLRNKRIEQIKQAMKGAE